MQHLSISLHPREEGLTPYPVRFQRIESALVPSMRAEGLRYHHPACEQHAVVWAASESDIATVLTCHYQDTWHTVTLQR